MIQHRHFTNGADVLAHAREVARSRYAPRRITPTRVDMPAEHAVPDAVVAPVTLPEGVGSGIDMSQAVAPAQDVVRDIIDLKGTLIPKAHAKTIVRLIANRHGLQAADILGRTRTALVVAARHEAISSIYVEFPHWSLEKIAQFFGVHHTSVLHAIRKMGVWRGDAA
ncbi:helix-turn-helix domain-containing protein [Microvirga lotononidis]|uniref:ATPase involved in DNA replication initiation n=1 Tax=Microvirga lotononidis TaxID=864069 RepID=I4YP27_9HYPH|nr:helix-turn-helix domain-containing protein [Microvirga lotononidis]EIM25719.1 ATPase involved in DNA replication initiation [Microvirga lotononidis]WQO25653.1 helix-turn-helix domain-containing protein [Microvirga lotononidis]